MNRRNNFKQDRKRSKRPSSNGKRPSKYGKRPSSHRPRLSRSEASEQSGKIDISVTGSESRYLMSLIEMSHPIVAVLQQGEQVAGRIVWYDQECIKIKPADESPDLIIPKTSIKYLLETSFPSLNPPIESENQEMTPGSDRTTPD